MVLLLCLGPAVVLTAQDGGVHYLHHGIMPPGAIGHQQLQRLGPLSGFFQPVEIKAPPGALVSLAAADQFGQAEAVPVRVGMQVGSVYRLRVTNLPLAEGLEVFPTIEIVNRLYPPPGQERRFPIPVELTQEDLNLALEGKFVTRVIYLEDPATAMPLRGDVAGQTWFELGPGRDPLAVADVLGRPVAIVRMGAKLPGDGLCPDPHFFYGSPPFVHYPPPPQFKPAAKTLPKEQLPPAPDRPHDLPPPMPKEALPASVPEKDQPPLPPGDRRTELNWQTRSFIVRGQAPDAADTAPQADNRPLPPASLPTPATAPARGQPWMYPVPPAYGAMGVPAPVPYPPTAPGYVPGMEQGLPLPQSVTSGAWGPPRMGPPEAANEYLRDGGDGQIRTRVGRNGEVRGLELEDTVVHFDTPDGRTLVEPSNQVQVYSPRFAAVRQVVSLVASEQSNRAAGVYTPLRLSTPRAVQPLASSKQNVQALGEAGARPSLVMLSKQGEGVVSNAIGPRSFVNAYKPYENTSVIRFGTFVESETAWLARGTTAAAVWTHNQAIQVIVDRQAAMVDVADRKLQMVYTVSAPPGNPRLRVVKVASTAYAQPGEEIDFTIRFDNIGNQRISHVTILDNLTTRLEYVPDSAQCSLPAEFSTQPNEGESLVVRCELKDSLAPGKGGVLRFRCRVR